MSSANGSGDLLPKQLISGRHLLVREPSAIKVNIGLNDVVVTNMKQLMPTFRAVDLSSLNSRFAQTPFEKPTIWLDLESSQDSSMVKMILSDGRRADVSFLYKKRQLIVTIEALAGLLANITDRQIIHSPTIHRAMDAPLLKVLLEMEKLAPIHLELSEINHHDEPFFATFNERIANKVKEASFCVGPTNAAIDWAQFEDCLKKFTNLRYLSISVEVVPPPSDWLRNAINANSQLKQLDMHDQLLHSPVVPTVVDSAVSAMAGVGGILFDFSCPEGWMAHVETDLCGLGPCTLTKIVLNMSQTGYLKIVVWHSPNILFCGDMLRICYYFLSLSNIGKKVVVRMASSLFTSVEEFVSDLGHFNFPTMQVKTGTGGPWYDYRVRVGRVTLYFCELL